VVAVDFIAMSFFTSLATRSLSQSAAMSSAIKNVTVIGSGIMGAGIAQVAAQTGHTVVMVDIDGAAVAKAEKRIGNSIKRVAKKKFGGEGDDASKFISEAIARLSTSTDAVASVGSADLVVEAIVENLGVKQKLFGELDKVAPQHTIFASNTSSFPIGKIGETTSRKDRFGGLHFFNPVPVMKLLEVVRIPETSEETISRMTTWGETMGKDIVYCKDTPGFVTNRLFIPYLLASMRLLERGDATKEGIDKACKLGLGYSMGPIELSDYIGLDSILFCSQGWMKDYPGVQEFEYPELLKKMVEEGKFGVKSGEGFYKYS